ncbi:MAG: MarR family winged helix-turn-helix transcriptional regulator, partial [Acidobacteriota bacterium]|nr:MarR family winged helix-turn-helix transcriptional regulator [Acidobacteriota bacterium]
DKIRLAETIAAECLAGRIRFLGRIVTGLYDRALRKLDITVNQTTILVFLTLHPETSQSSIGRILQMEKSTVSRNLDRMRKKGWIEISPGSEWSVQAVRVTASGDRLLLSLYREWEKAQSATRELLGDEGIRSVHTIFNTLKEKDFAAGSDL